MLHVLTKIGSTTVYGIVGTTLEALRATRAYVNGVSVVAIAARASLSRNDLHAHPRHSQRLRRRPDPRGRRGLPAAANPRSRGSKAPNSLPQPSLPS